MNMANMPKPYKSAARLVAQTARIRMIFMSTSGERDRISDHTHSTTSAAVAR